MEAACVVYGFLISLAVSLLKRIPFVAKFPKVVASVLSALLAVGNVFLGGATYASIAEIVKCVAEQLAISIAAYEVITKSVARNLNVREES